MAGTPFNLRLIDGAIQKNFESTYNEKHDVEITLEAGAVDVAHYLGFNPRAVYVLGGEGVTFKYGTAPGVGTDEVPVNPMAVMCENGGAAFDMLELSNASAADVQVRIVAYA